ncbi:hypothetical protein FHG87_011924, partial [Trinorchestia longiramus]
FNVGHVPLDARSRQFVGSKTVLYQSVLKLKRPCVLSLMTEGHSPWTRNADDGRMAIHAAVSIGDHTLVQDLVREMKRVKQLEKLDFKSDSFSLLQSVLCTYEHRDDESHQKCLELLFAKDILLNVTQKSPNGL